MLFLEEYFYFVRTHKKIDKVMYNYWARVSSVCHTIKWENFRDEKYKAYAVLKDWYLNHGEDYNFESMVGMIFGEIIANMCGEKSYSFCKDYINSDSRFGCIKNYNSIEIPPFYYRTVKSFMAHPLLFWISKKVIYIIKKFIGKLMDKYSATYKFCNYVTYRIIRKYSVISEDHKKFIEKWSE